MIDTEDLPKTVKRTRQYQDYEVMVECHTEWVGDLGVVARKVEAKAIVGGREVATGDMRVVSQEPTFIDRVLSAISSYDREMHTGISEEDHVQMVLEDLYEKMKLVESRGSVDDPSKVDAALDSVFGKPKSSDLYED